MAVSVASWNVNSLRVRSGHIIDWLQSNLPDILALQETKIKDEDFPAADFSTIGYKSVFHGQPTYNGVAILSREQPQYVQSAIPDYDDVQCRVLLAYFAKSDLAVLNLYVPNGSEIGSEKYSYKLQWLDKLQQYVTDLGRQYRRLVLVGDFNIAPADIDVYDPDLWRGKVLCSEPERASLARILGANDMIDVFRSLHPEAVEYSWWDYRQAAFRRNLGLRIDHILATPALIPESCGIDKAPRKLERPSDHAPIHAVFS